MVAPKKNVNFILSLEAIELLEDMVYARKKDQPAGDKAVFKSGLIEELIKREAKRTLK